MSFFEEMAAVARELLGPGPETMGEQVTITRRGSGYDPVTRKTTAGGTLVQVLWGTLEAAGPGQGDLAQVSLAGSLTRTYERLLTAVPTTSGGFEPGLDDRVTAEGKTWQVKEVAHVIKQGIPIIWVCGMVSA